MQRFLKIFAVATVVQIVVVMIAFVLRFELVIIPYWFVGLLIFDGLKLYQFVSDGLLAVILMFGTPFLLVSAVIAGLTCLIRRPSQDLP